MPRPVTTSPTARALGQQGEDAAAHYLESCGYELIARNWRYGRLGEIDAVALLSSAAVLAFVEVKTRRAASAETPFDAVTPQKRRTLTRLALAFLAEHPQYQAYSLRFDVIAALAERGGLRLYHLPNAFEAFEFDL
ncbi:MAG: YraN family protein [Vampirovibrionales bacterium]|nr:YraN family protein [Vampirovibrionales bacterium]